MHVVGDHAEHVHGDGVDGDDSIVRGVGKHVDNAHMGHPEPSNLLGETVSSHDVLLYREVVRTYILGKCEIKVILPKTFQRKR